MSKYTYKPPMSSAKYNKIEAAVFKRLKELGAEYFIPEYSMNYVRLFSGDILVVERQPQHDGQSEPVPDAYFISK